MLLAELPWQVFMTPFGIPIAGIIGVFGWMTVASISEGIAKVICNRNDTELKMELLAQGYTSEEMIRVVESGRESATPA